MLSYVEIIAWQEDCLREAISPRMRDTITQYINLLEHLTHQNTPMNNQIANMVLSRDDGTLAAYLELVSAEDAVRSEIFTRLRASCEKVAERLELDLDLSVNLADKESGFGFSNTLMDGENIRISFQFSFPNFRGLKSGISYRSLEEKLRAAQSTVQFWDRISKEFLRKIADPIPSPLWWLGMSAWGDRSDWEKDGTLADIAFGRGDFQSQLADRVGDLLAVIRSARDEKS